MRFVLVPLVKSGLSPTIQKLAEVLLRTFRTGWSVMQIGDWLHICVRGSLFYNSTPLLSLYFLDRSCFGWIPVLVLSYSIDLLRIDYEQNMRAQLQWVSRTFSSRLKLASEPARSAASYCKTKSFVFGPFQTHLSKLKYIHLFIYFNLLLQPETLHPYSTAWSRSLNSGPQCCFLEMSTLIIKFRLTKFEWNYSNFPL